MLHTHYLAVFLLPALGLFHLLFVPRARRWWLVPACLRAGPGHCRPAAPARFPRAGLHRQGSRGGWFPPVAGDSPRISCSLCRMDSSTFPGLLARYCCLPCSLVPALFFLLRTQTRQHLHCFFLLFTSAALLAQALIMNNVFKIMSTSRIQYLMPLWPLCAVLAGAALARAGAPLSPAGHRPAGLVVSLWRPAVAQHELSLRTRATSTPWQAAIPFLLFEPS